MTNKKITLMVLGKDKKGGNNIKKFCDANIDTHKPQINVKTCRDNYDYFPFISVHKGKKFVGYADTKMLGGKQIYFSNKSKQGVKL